MSTGVRLQVVPASLTDARRFVDKHHRHHKAPIGGLFAIGVAEAEKIIGVAIVGRPVARMLYDGWTIEVTRVAVMEGYPNACSMLYGACWRIARAMGYRKAITYTLKSEAGTSVQASGWRVIAEVNGRSWHTQRRPRVDKHPLEDKLRWEVTSPAP